MKEFVFNLPTEIHFGRGAEDCAGELCARFGRKKVMIVAGKHWNGSELLRKVEKSLADNDIRFMTIADVSPNPLITDIRCKIKTAVSEKCDFVIGLGGGSAIDTAKAVAFGAASPETDVEDYYTMKARITKTLGCGAILTIAATGSENSMASMATLDDIPSHPKASAAAPCCRPLFALMNPENTFSLPPFQVAVGTADIMMHTMDRYFTTVDGNELTDQIAESILRVAIASGAVAVNDPTDYDSMSELMWCGSLSHNGLTNAGRPMDFTIHQIGNVFSGVFNANHGACMAILWTRWAERVYKNDVQRFARFARNVWSIEEAADEEAAVRGIRKTGEYFFTVLKIPSTFKELGVELDDEKIVELANMVTANGQRKPGQFKPLIFDEVVDIYTACK